MHVGLGTKRWSHTTSPTGSVGCPLWEPQARACITPIAPRLGIEGVPPIPHGAPSNRRTELAALYESLLCYMRLPHQLLESPFFLFSTTEELVHALGLSQNDPETEE